MVRIDFELTAVFQQLGQAPVNELRRVVADRFLNFLLHLAAGLALHLPEDFEKQLGNLVPLPVGDIQITGNEPVARVPNTDELASQHGSPKGMMLPPAFAGELFRGPTRDHLI